MLNGAAGFSHLMAVWLSETVTQVLAWVGVSVTHIAVVQFLLLLPLWSQSQFHLPPDSQGQDPLQN